MTTAAVECCPRTTRQAGRAGDIHRVHVYDGGQHLWHPQMPGLPLPRS
ncbi:hypothetical protein JBE27_05505 [Streptomyces albiflaviniger]|nr:hypothetical protein [Streptomyces albiflaviniger]